MRSTDSRTCASEIPTRPSPLKGDSVGCGSHVWSPGLQNNSSHTFGIHTGPCPPSSSCFVCYGLFQPRRTFVDIVIRRRRFLAGTQKLEARLKTNDDEETNFRLSILSVSSRRQRTFCSINFSSFSSAQNSAGILVCALTPCLQTERGTQTPAVASSAPARRDLTIPCGSNTNFFAAPLSKSR